VQGNPNDPYQSYQGEWQQNGMTDSQYPFQQPAQNMYGQPQQYPDMYQQTQQYAPVQPQQYYPDMYQQQTQQYAPVQPQQYPDMYQQQTQQYAPVQPQQYYPNMYQQQTQQYAPVQPQQYYPDMYQQQTQQYAPVQPQQYLDMYQQQTQQYAPVQPQQYVPDMQQQTQQYAPVKGQMSQEQMWQMLQGQNAPGAEPLHPNMYNQQGKPKRKKKKSGPKRPGSSPLRGALIAALIVLVLGAGVWFLVQRGQSGKNTTATVEASTVGTSYRGDALIVRNEVAFDEEGVQNIEYVAQEGSVVYRGNVLCYVYSTGYSISEMQTLQDYRDQITDFEQSLLSNETAYDQRMERLEGEVISHGLEVRSLVQGTRGNMIQQEQILDTAILQRQNYFRTKYSEEPRLTRLFDDEATQTQRIESWIKQKSANQESIVSFYTDGYEYALSPSNFESYTPTQVRNMINGEKPDAGVASRGRTTLYRLVKQQDYVVLLLIRDSTWTPKDGDTYKLVLEQFSSTVVDAKVLSSTRTGNELLVRLAVMGDVTDVLYMRTCTAELGKHVDCMKVPEKALYTQNGNTGVVIVTEEGQFFIPVNVMDKQGGSAYITAIQTGQLAPGMTVQLFD